MVKLSGAQRELMEILWENKEMTLHALTRAALGNAVTPNRTDAIRVVLLQMVSKGAVAENAAVSPHIYTPLVGRDEIGFESGFLAAAQGNGNALLTALSVGISGFGSGTVGAEVSDPQPSGPKRAVGPKGDADEEQRAAVRAMMDQICRERDEYEAEKAGKKSDGASDEKSEK